MCLDQGKIKFCSCSDEKENPASFAEDIEELYRKELIKSQLALIEGKYKSKFYKWTLYRLDQIEQINNMAGKILGTPANSNHRLNEKNLLSILNSKNDIFDFEFEPAEDDLLEIKESYCYVTLESHSRNELEYRKYFKFKDGKWSSGKTPLNYIYKKNGSGKIDLS